MLVQIPLLIGMGYLLRGRCLRMLARVTPLEPARHQRLGAGQLMSRHCWMLPRTLDVSVTLPLIAAAKFLSLPLLIGLPLALSWPR